MALAHRLDNGARLDPLVDEQQYGRHLVRKHIRPDGQTARARARLI
jgi:hypothetical protein